MHTHINKKNLITLFSATFIMIVVGIGICWNMDAKYETLSSANIMQNPTINKAFSPQTITTKNVQNVPKTTNLPKNIKFFPSIGYDIGAASTEQRFTIQPTIDVDFSNGTVGQNDTAIRESHLNNNNGITLTLGNTFMPDGDTSLTEHYIIPTTSNLKTESFSEIIRDTDIDPLYFKLSLANLLKNADNKLYPFLEYQIKFCGNVACSSTVTAPDRFFHIKGSAQVGKYNVDIQIDKPIVESSLVSDFAVLF